MGMTAKGIGVIGVTAFFFAMCRYLHIAPLALSLLAGWGAFCFLFSFELSGRHRRIRQGLEEKTPLQRAWMVAGLICLLVAWIAIFRAF